MNNNYDMTTYIYIYVVYIYIYIQHMRKDFPKERYCTCVYLCNPANSKSSIIEA